MLALAHQLAAGETLKPEDLAQLDQKTARGLTRLLALRGVMLPESAASWGHLRDLQAAGQGSFGEVFSAFDPTLNRTVALKLRRSDLDVVHSGRDFIAEAQRMARVRHPHVLAVHGASYHAGRAGIWSDWIEGETLHALLTREHALPYPRWLKLAVELANALAAVHQQNLVHADIKASNVMIDAAGHSILMDFGAGFDQSPEAQITTGTPGYLAPEVLAGQPVDQCIDIFALGVLLHLALTGSKPAGEQVSGEIKPLPVRRLLARMLHQQPAQRPNAAQLVSALNAVQALPLTRAKRRNRWLAFTALSLISVVSSVGYWVSTKEKARAVQTRDYLVEVLRFSNPYQSDKPTQRLHDLYKNAVALVPARLANDPHTQAELLNQFGRSLLMLDQEGAALQALRQAKIVLETRDVAITDPLHLTVRTNLVDTYLRLRQFDDALALRVDDLAVCAGLGPNQANTGRDPAANARCIDVLNSYSESLGLSGHFERAQTPLLQARALSLDSAIEQTYRAAYTIYLQGVMARELGKNQQAFQHFTELTERTLRVVPATHPGLASDLFLMAGVASELGDVELALKLNAAAVKARSALFGNAARLTINTRLLQAVLHLQRNERSAAAELLRILRGDLLATPSFRQHREDVGVWLAMADPSQMSDAELLALRASRLEAYGAANVRNVEYQIRLSWAWLARSDLARARAQNNALSLQLATLPTAAQQALRPAQLLLQSELALRSGDVPKHAQMRTELLPLLAVQHRLLWHPLSGEKVGLPPPQFGQMQATLADLYVRVLARRRSAQAPGS